MTGRDLGRYRLAPGQDPVAGVPLRAEDTLLERQVDLILVPDAVTAEPARLDRVRHEVERAAGFVHPDAAGVYGLEEGDGRLFVTCEPRAGRDLERSMAGAGLSPDRALEIALALCDVLASAQQEGVVHGTLGPGDVALGDAGSVTVGGFGLRELRRSHAGRPAAAAWHAPETAAGLMPDHRSDVWSLGRMVRAMLAAAGPGAEPEGLTAVLDRCLSDDPADRPRSAAELRAPLEEARRGLLEQPGPAPEPAATETGRRFGPLVRLGPAQRWGLLAALALGGLLAAWALWRGSAERPEPVAAPATEHAAPGADLVDLAVLPFAGGEGEVAAALARGFGLEVTRLLARDRRVSVVDAGSAASAAAVDPDLAPAAGEGDGGGARGAAAARRRAAARLGVAHLLEGGFRWQRDDDMSRAEVTLRLTRAGDGEVLWRETLEAFFNEVGGLQGQVTAGAIARLVGGDGRQPPPPTASPGAYGAYLEALGRAAVAGSLADLRAAAAGFETAVSLDPALLPAHTRLVGLRLELAGAGDGEAELAAARAALAAARRLDAADPEVGRAAGELELLTGGDPGAAREELAAALERLPGDPGLLRSIAWIDRRQGRWDEAIAGLAAARRRSPLGLELMADLVRALTWTRRFGEAGREADRLAAALPDAPGPDLWRADLLLRQAGDTARARAVLEGMPEAARADPGWQRRMLRLDIYEGRLEAALDRLPAIGLEQGEELVERAWIRRHMGDARRAAAQFESAKSLLGGQLEADPDNPWLSSLLAQAYAGTGGVNVAARLGQRAVAQLPVTSDAVAGAELVERLARTYVLAGDFEHAIDELAFLLEIPSPLTVAVVRLDPTWRPLLGEARFRDLLERLAS